MQKIVITKLDEDSILVECDDLITQPFHESDRKDMLLFILSYIKKLEVSKRPLTHENIRSNK